MADIHVGQCGAGETVTVRIRLLMNADGKWTAYGWNGAAPHDTDDVLYEMMGSEDTTTARAFYLTAEVPKPQPVEIAAEVSCEFAEDNP